MWQNDKVGDKIVGDVDFDAVIKSKAITPVHSR